MLNAALADSLITRNPCSASNVSKPRAAHGLLVPWQADRVAAVREAMPERYKILADLGSALWLRQGEAFGLAVADFDFVRPARLGGPVVHVRRQVKLLGSKSCCTAESTSRHCRSTSATTARPAPWPSTPT